MADPRFYDSRGPFALGALATEIGATLSDGADPDFAVQDLSSLDDLVPGSISYATTARNAEKLQGQATAAVIVTAAVAAAVPPGIATLIHPEPAFAFAHAAGLFYPDAGRASASGTVFIDPSAELEDGVTLEPGVVIGRDARIGAGTHLAAHAVIGRGVCIGRNSYVGPHVSLAYTLVGDRVVIFAGARIGSDGFGFVPGSTGLRKVPQLGRVIIQDAVEIGANACVDRGSLGDTVIGEGSKIDNLVQVAHNSQLGRYVILAAQVGLSGSVTIGDGSILGGQVGVADHRTIGPGSRIAASSGVSRDLPGNADYGGAPAQPIREWKRELMAVRRLGKGTRRQDD
ncbi:UDP-3-O-acylglucosamine N-acyltransferase [Alphaproteobacteria bacterium SO-S41]|nr:UDP-3-O-acylglucosamine N-acyltransferase [Alphaproteobacteria bacterium SO-S41]